MTVKTNNKDELKKTKQKKKQQAKWLKKQMWSKMNKKIKRYEKNQYK